MLSHRGVAAPVHRHLQQVVQVILKLFLEQKHRSTKVQNTSDWMKPERRGEPCGWKCFRFGSSLLLWGGRGSAPSPTSSSLFSWSSYCRNRGVTSASRLLVACSSRLLAALPSWRQVEPPQRLVGPQVPVKLHEVFLLLLHLPGELAVFQLDLIHGRRRLQQHEPGQFAPSFSRCFGNFNQTLVHISPSVCSIRENDVQS